MTFKKLLEWITKQIEKVTKRNEKRILKAVQANTHGNGKCAREILPPI